MRANLYRLRDASFAILFNFCGQFHNARRFGGLHRKTPSPFLAACNETQRPPKPYPFNVLHLWRTSTSDLTPRRGSAACTARRLRPFLPPAMRRNACPNTTLFNPPHLWRTHTSSFLSHKLYFDHHFLRITQIIQTMKVSINKIQHYQFNDDSSILRSVDFL